MPEESDNEGVIVDESYHADSDINATKCEGYKITLQPSLWRQFLEITWINLILKKRDWVPTFEENLNAWFILFILVILNRTLTTRPGLAPDPSQLPRLSSGCAFSKSSTPCVLMGVVVDQPGSVTTTAWLSTLNSLISDAESSYFGSTADSGSSTKEVTRLFESRKDLIQFKAANPSNIVVGLELFSLNEATLQTNYSVWVNDTVFLNDYISNYYVTAQAYMDRAVVNVARAKSNLVPYKSPLSYTATNGIWTATVAGRFSTLSGILAYYFVFLFQNIPGNVLLRMSQDKDKLRPGLAIMGMSETISMLSICMVQWLFSLLPISVVVAVACTFSLIFVYTTWSILFVAFALFSASAVFFGVILSVLFPDKRQAAGMSILAMVIALTWYAVGEISILDKPGVSLALQHLWLIIPQAALGRFIRLAAVQEQVLQGVTWDNLWTIGNNNGGSGWALVMLVVDVFVWAFLAWYYNLRYPGLGRQGLPRGFFLSPSYWRLTSVVVDETEESATSSSAHALVRQATTESLEPVDFDALEPGAENVIRIADVLKEFNAPRKGPIAALIQAIKSSRSKGKSSETTPKSKRALDGMTLDLHGGQTLALLGHNGAGKTTLISILCGSLPATSGSVKIRVPHPTKPGSTVRLSTSNFSHVAELRKSLGVCPQFDVQYPELTCKEHIRLYMALKGAVVTGSTTGGDQSPHALQEGYIKALLADVDLSQKINARVKTLSGGQQRKLSLACSLLGDPTLLLLDEPTTGMDVHSITHVWTLLQELKKRPGRVIVLTTHSMEEADALGDRVAIMSKGKLQVCGSSMFLKRQYGIGPRLLVDVAQQTSNTSGVVGAPSHADGDEAASGLEALKSHRGIQKILSIVCSIIPDAHLESGEVQSAVIVLPNNGTTASDGRAHAKRLASVFETLQAAHARGELFGVVSIGLGQTTLEEVFLNLKDKDEKDSS